MFSRSLKTGSENVLSNVNKEDCNHSHGIEIVLDNFVKDIFAWSFACLILYQPIGVDLFFCEFGEGFAEAMVTLVRVYHRLVYTTLLEQDRNHTPLCSKD